MKNYFKEAKERERVAKATKKGIVLFDKEILKFFEENGEKSQSQKNI